MNFGRKSFQYVQRMLPLFRAVVKFCSTSRLFTYFQRRYSKKQVGDLNTIVKLRGKIRTGRFSISFYRLYLANRVSLNETLSKTNNVRA